MNIFKAIIKRPAFWTFLAAGVAFGSVYFVEEKADPILLLEFIKAALALLGIGALGKMGYDSYKAKTGEKNG